jgi:dTDP-4-dehydrorhamnose 3,5-epimerase
LGLFVIFDDRKGSVSVNEFQVINISESENYCRLTVPPMVWLGFQGIKNKNILINIASIEHSPHEVDQKTLTYINFDWEILK